MSSSSLLLLVVLLLVVLLLLLPPVGLGVGRLPIRRLPTTCPKLAARLIAWPGPKPTGRGPFALPEPKPEVDD